MARCTPLYTKLEVFPASRKEESGTRQRWRRWPFWLKHQHICYGMLSGGVERGGRCTSVAWGSVPSGWRARVQEWLCLNCQMQRALGMDMTTPTPRSKSQQQIHSPSHQAKPEPQAPLPAPGPGPPEHQAPPQSMPHAPPQASPGPQRQARPPGGAMHTGPDQRLPQPPGGGLPGLAKAPSQPDLSRPAPSRQDHARSAGSSPSKQPPPPQDQPFGKLFGFGASLLNQASTLISVDPTQGAAPPPSPAKPAPSAASKPPGPAGRAGGAPPPQQHAPPTHQQTPPPQKQQAPPPQQQPAPKTSCPLCKTALNVGSTEPPNYNSCTQCHTQVCNLCGFNPTPHLLEVRLCHFIAPSEMQGLFVI
ncbi:hypothetical protein AAFF_G00398610 [Aldrovandia affinis]|uniref:Zinc finger piccolo-type domain-containing protein n=1 Tax=Aldrovandia affinis TaxID=143900 RepID=A0AAD7WKF1_9TELE|nr:hypothetical protein AAFF_G00398610 [Aldrovandia affinis]